MTNGAILAFYIGPSAVIGGTKTDMVAWANNDVFLQIWIGADDKLPRRIRAMYRADPLALRHEVELFSNWQLDPAVRAGHVRVGESADGRTHGIRGARAAAQRRQAVDHGQVEAGGGAKAPAKTN